MTTLAGLRTLRDLDLARSRVLIRVDFNLPLRKGAPADDTRIREAIPTIRHAMEAGARVIVASHVTGNKPGQEAHLSLEAHGQRLAELTGYEVHLPEDCVGDAPRKVIQDLREGQLCLLENLGRHAGEAEDSPDFARQLADLCDIYVNDAFSLGTRSWASLHALPRQMRQRACGLRLEQELQAVGQLLTPERPSAALIGGTRMADKLPYIEALLERIDHLLIGGALANTFLKARRKNLQIPRVEEDKVALAQSILQRAEKRGVTVLLPTDVVVGQNSSDPEGKVVPVDAIPAGKVALDIGPDTRKAFASRLDRASTIYWNGPVGAHDSASFAGGTRAMLETLSQATGFTVVSGGDTLAALAAVGDELRGGINHLSSAGDAVLDLLSGRRMPAIEALRT
ncbi:MAG: phosphoglycerate kinase [Polyangiaceae bacterium]|nr:phosphoglycerate kinase [Polyangiaceae bacterium]